MIHRIYPDELEIKDTCTTDTVKSVLYLDLHLKIDNKGKLLTKLYDQRDDFSFRIANFLFISGNIPSAPVVLISQSHVMPELSVNMQTFCIVLDFLNMFIFLQDWSHHYRSFMVIIMNSWILSVHPSASWKLICSTCHSFHFLLHLPWTWLWWVTGRMFLEKQGTLSEREQYKQKIKRERNWRGPWLGWESNRA